MAERFWSTHRAAHFTLRCVGAAPNDVALSAPRTAGRLTALGAAARPWITTLFIGLLTTAVAACATPSPGRRTNTLARGPEEPLPTELNRNAPPPGENAGRAHPHVVLWCSQPLGPACLAAQQELGQAPTPAAAVPMPLLSQARDSADDCADPDLAPLMQRVTDAVGVAVGGWTDQGGPFPTPEHIADLYAGSGCTNAARPGDPPVKMHAADVDGEPHFLVRIWELDEAR